MSEKLNFEAMKDVLPKDFPLRKKTLIDRYHKAELIIKVYDVYVYLELIDFSKNGENYWFKIPKELFTKTYKQLR